MDDPTDVESALEQEPVPRNGPTEGVPAEPIAGQKRVRNGRRTSAAAEPTAEASTAAADAEANDESVLRPDDENPDDNPAADEPLIEDDAEEDDESARAFLAGGAYATVAIDRYDDLPAIFGKLDSAASPRVALIAARGNRELQRSLSMRRLQRHLDLTGKDVILVSRSRALRARAREERLPAVGSLRRVNFHEYGGGLRLGAFRIPLPSIGSLVALAALVVAVGAGAAVLFWYLPKATVTVFLPVTTMEDSVNVSLDGQTTVVNLETGTVPARRREVLVTKSIYRPATGVQQVPKDNAAVALRLTNRTNTQIRVPKGTVALASSGIKFTTAADVDLLRLNATGDVVALAQQAGTAGNVPANTIRVLEGDLAQTVAVTNPAPGEKGTDVPQQVVSEADIEGVRAFAEPILIDTARTDLLLRLAETATVFGGTATVQVTEIKGNPAVNVPSPYTEVKVTGKASLLTVDDDFLRQIYVNHFRPQLPPETMLLENEFTTGSVQLGELERALDRQAATLQVKAATAPAMDREALQKALAGQGKKGAEAVVRALVDTPQPPLVKISPSWAPRLPRRADRITVTFAPAPQSAP